MGVNASYSAKLLSWSEQQEDTDVFSDVCDVIRDSFQGEYFAYDVYLKLKRTNKENLKRASQKVQVRITSDVRGKLVGMSFANAISSSTKPYAVLCHIQYYGKTELPSLFAHIEAVLGDFRSLEMSDKRHSKLVVHIPLGFQPEKVNKMLEEEFGFTYQAYAPTTVHCIVEDKKKDETKSKL